MLGVVSYIAIIFRGCREQGRVASVAKELMQDTVKCVEYKNWESGADTKGRLRWGIEGEWGGEERGGAEVRSNRIHTGPVVAQGRRGALQGKAVSRV
ncbi:hypothetical protein AMTR_s00036p00218430 [Amborella trichopoda]|uniref:Uncharacterized protein n=1 Tax=Amborella trichopoda TaxID=13333 RepID=U5CZ31_AMBTC|nr:hypothetical protein AMTR_s00036p00218430 [Amborella trichopoda]